MLYISILPLEKFRDLMTTGELYFCRADLFTNDVREGLPPEEYLPAFGLHPLDVLDRQQLCHHIGSDAQFRKKANAPRPLRHRRPAVFPRIRSGTLRHEPGFQPLAHGSGGLAEDPQQFPLGRRLCGRMIQSAKKQAAA